jgi:hypothetical protein
MIRHVSMRWQGVLVAAALLAARFAHADSSSPNLDRDWYTAVARAESLLTRVQAGGQIDSVDRAAVAEQIRLGVYVLGSLVQASTSADSLLAGPSAVSPTEEPRHRGWLHGIARVIQVLAATATLLPLAASMGRASPQAQRALAYIGSSVAGIGSVVHRSKSGSTPNANPDSNSRIRTVGLEAELHDAVRQTEGTAESLWQDLRGIALDSCATTDQVVSLARRYANALPAAELLGSEMKETSALALTCAEHPGFDQRARARLSALSSHLETIGGLWNERRWLFERSRRNALDFLVLVDRP